MLQGAELTCCKGRVGAFGDSSRASGGRAGVPGGRVDVSKKACGRVQWI